MWYDTQEHEHQDCDDFNEAYRKNIVFWKDNKIHLRATKEPIRVNFGQGGMKKLAEEILHNVTKVDAATYGLQVFSKTNNDDAKACGDLWPYTLKTAKRGKVSQGKSCEAENYIPETRGWLDPVDSLSVYAYIAKLKPKEALVEEKQKCNEETARSSKRATKSSNKKEEVPKPMPEVNMEEAPKDKKQEKPRGPFYKLKSDIEWATNLKKVFEEGILNSKVEMTLNDILGIAKIGFPMFSPLGFLGGIAITFLEEEEGDEYGEKGEVLLSFSSFNSSLFSWIHGKKDYAKISFSLVELETFGSVV
ncbi:hypothetical protein L7F22_039905 [Adiantum nelumboides]|nr:hypothetical protein [Adiantum nelumboides]